PSGCLPVASPEVADFILVGGLVAFVFLSRPNRVHLRYGSRVRLTTRQSHYWNPRSFGYMLNRQFTWRTPFSSQDQPGLSWQPTVRERFRPRGCYGTVLGKRA